MKLKVLVQMLLEKLIYNRDDDFNVSCIVAELAHERGEPNAQIAPAWLFSKPVITAPIIGSSSKPGRLEDAAGVLSFKAFR